MIRILNSSSILYPIFFNQAAWKPRPFPATRGTLYKYIKNVASEIGRAHV